jgi:hypothetical protein
MQRLLYLQIVGIDRRSLHSTLIVFNTINFIMSFERRPEFIQGILVVFSPFLKGLLKNLIVVIEKPFNFADSGDS